MPHARKPAAPDPAPRHTEGDFRDGVPFLGGRLWIDLLNTTPMTGDGPRDLIATPDDFALWAVLARLQPPPPSALAKAHKAVLGLRRDLRTLFDDLAKGGPPRADIADTANRALAPVHLHPRMAIEGDRYVLREEAGGAEAAIALDVARFLCDFEPERLKHCANPACNMVFYDGGRNGRRRWCSMSVCGNRDKVSRFRARHSEKTEAS
ncbi:CGNR zinc finger domain-containing protein [Aquabacter sp. L1I39]|uniref:CGNR zinc finger domain-containing protein n=1 Tax=Aquabacter sp. L1I39 TaxID=2820278 RepID=UPI001ADD247D|nr:CGNR zinc finger domain-containing protein [Aquabacter sp. L1I39]QTL02008.1 CGNR zinc finger domain-containing protein [Aquabacter sp. L1I39]